MSGRKKTDEAFQVSSIGILDSFIGGAEAEPEDGFHFVPIASVRPHPQQPRRYFDEEKLAQLAASIGDAGILQPLLVRRLEGDSFELVAGERRYRAATMAGLKEVPVIIRELSDEQVREFALMENLAREDLNPIEETEGVLELVAAKLDCSRLDVVKLLQVGGHRERDSAKEVTGSSQWQTVEEVFAKIGRFTPESFRVNRLPLLNLPEEILGAIREGKIEYSKARLIARVKSDKQRRELLEAAIEGQLSRSQINEMIKASKAKTTKEKKESVEIVRQMSAIYKQVKKAKFTGDSEKQKRIKTLLDELEALLEE